MRPGRGSILIFCHDNTRLAEYGGWTDIHTHDGIVTHGMPPEDEMRFLGWRRKQRARSGCLDIPYFPADAFQIQRLEAKLHLEGKRDEYIKNLRKLCEDYPEAAAHHKVKAPDPEWAMATANGYARAAAILLTIGFMPD